MQISGLVQPCWKVAVTAAAVAAALAATACGSGGSVTSAAGKATATTTAAAASASPSAGFPLTISNCGQKLTFDAPPARTVSMDQIATEALLGIGVGKSVVGTANQAEPIWPTLKAAYDAIPVIGKQGYPSKEQLLSVQPDFVVGNEQAFTYTGFPSGSNFTRTQLTAMHVNSFTLVCNGQTVVTQEDLYQDYTELGKIFGVPAQAAKFIAAIKAGLAATESKLAGQAAVDTFFYSGGTGPLGTYGGAQEGLVLSGGKNLFASLPPLVGGMPPTVSAEQVIARNPAAILVENEGELDPTSPSIAQEEAYLRKTLATTTAVKNGRFCVTGFYDFGGGLRTVAAVASIAKCLHPDLHW